MKLSLKQSLVILLHAFIGWAICGAIMGIGPTLTTMENTLILHAIGGPVAFAALSYIYHSEFNYTSPIITAAIFILFVILMDLILVSAIILKNFDMFASFLGTWFPFILIVLLTYLVGLYVNKRT